MNKKHLIWATIIITAIVFCIVFINIGGKTKQSPSGLEGCKTLRFSNQEAINLVFFGSEKNSRDYMEFILSAEPFKDYKEALNFYYIDTYEPECETYKGVAILCHSRETIKKAGSCPNDFVIVLKDVSGNLRSSAYMNTISINTNHPKTAVIHELAHVLANLDDEYVPASLSSKSLNCVSRCEKFKNENDGCFSGCSKEEYYRSVEKGVMRTLSTTEFGKYDSNIIKELLIKRRGKITGNAIVNEVDCEVEKYYLVSGKYDDGIKIIESSLETGCPNFGESGFYYYSLLNSNDELIAKSNLNNPSRIFTDLPEEERIVGGAIQYDGMFFLAIPYVNDAKTLKIVDENGIEVTSVELNDKLNRACRIS